MSTPPLHPVSRLASWLTVVALLGNTLGVAAPALAASPLNTRAVQATKAGHTPTAPTSLVVDGIIDAGYGAPIATDPVDPPQGNTNLDLGSLYVSDTVDSLYIAFTIHANIQTTNWGKYLIYFDTTGNGAGATTDAWGRNVIVTGTHKPEYSLNAWVDQPFGPSTTQLWAWGGSSWSQVGSAAEAARVGAATSVIEYRLPKSALGNPSQIWMEVYSTGGTGSDNAQDTINDPPNDWNATNWSTQAVLMNSTHYVMSGSGGGGGPVTTECVTNATQDGVVTLNALGHNSRDPLYRTPGGPVTTGTPVTLRFRAAQNDLTAARVRVYNDRTNVSTLYALSKTATHNGCDWWEVTLPPSADPTIYWYRFLAIDGSATAYYEDADFQGGWGDASGSSSDRSWQLTVYHPDLYTPDWAKNAVMYQIFVDRFRDGNPANNTVSGTFFYAEGNGIVTGTVTRSLDPEGDWNTVVCDPRATGVACSGSYSRNFYGGDLQGIIDKLDYLQDLGVTALYLNPIFESPSNHKYDASMYGYIDDNFGDLATFITLTTEAGNRGMHIVLDGVFNHVSSDSPYLDRYSRWTADSTLSPTPGVNDGSGACESLTSPYRSWFYFTDVLTGTGVCVSSNGTPNSAVYESWFGYDSLPKLRATSTEIRNLIWASPTTSPTASIGKYWLEQGAAGWRLDVGGDVDPGTTNDPTNDYWEGFRIATRDTYSQTYIVGEEWGNGSAWLLGTEWDATMNYQYSSAMLSFWRDSTFVDNDHNSGSSAGTLAPLTPSQLNERLLNWQERYPPEVYYAQMNLLGSHDTNRPLFMLDHNTHLNNPALYEDPNYDWSDAMARQKGVVIMQFTLPGAPTIYYGDEVGLVGPPALDGSGWQDDPYNRQPFPWLDETGTPFYTHLQTPTGQNELRDFYRLLTHARNNHPALRTGSFDPLVVNDAGRVYAYGRKLADDAALVLLNRFTATQVISVNVAGYLPNGAVLTNVLESGAAYTVTGGLITVSVPARFGAVLVLAQGDLTPPAAPVLSLTAELTTSLALSWTNVPSATEYLLFRSPIGGGAYTPVYTGTGTAFTDTAVMVGNTYYYYVQARSATGLLSAASNTVNGIAHPLAFYMYVYPAAITHTVGITPTDIVSGFVQIPGFTDVFTEALPFMHVQVGFGLSGTNPLSWTDWVEADFAGISSYYHYFETRLIPEAAGDYWYVVRLSTTQGRDWQYADYDDLYTPPALPPVPGLLTVTASADTDLPATPLNLHVTDWSADYIALAWQANTEPDLYAYDLYRASADSPAAFLARIVAPGLHYTDTTVVNGQTYTYTLQAVDYAFNRSNFSNAVTQTAEQKMVNVAIRVGVPAYTPPGTIFIAGDIPGSGMPTWNPSATPLTQLEPAVWGITLSIPDGTVAPFKFTRGNWDTVEQWDSIAGFANRTMTVTYGLTGTQFLDLTATDWGNGPDSLKAVRLWRDPLVVDASPANGATNVPLNASVHITWSEAMTNPVTFDVQDANTSIAGSFIYNPTNFSVTFTPTTPWALGTTYTVTVTGRRDAQGDTQQVPFIATFTTMPPYVIYLPSVQR